MSTNLLWLLILINKPASNGLLPTLINCHPHIMITCTCIHIFLYYNATHTNRTQRYSSWDNRNQWKKIIESTNNNNNDHNNTNHKKRFNWRHCVITKTIFSSINRSFLIETNMRAYVLSSTRIEPPHTDTFDFIYLCFCFSIHNLQPMETWLIHFGRHLKFSVQNQKAD